MFNLDDDTGDITIDFSIPADDPTAEPTAVKVVVAPPPTFGAYKRLRAEIDRINRSRDQLLKQLAADDDVGAAEMNSRLNSFQEDALLDWWSLVMAGDDSYRGQATGEVPDREQWPLYLVANESMQQALAHWKTVPLARGGQLVARES